jgi:hypothetical protein
MIVWSIRVNALVVLNGATGTNIASCQSRRLHQAISVGDNSSRVEILTAHYSFLFALLILRELRATSRLYNTRTRTTIREIEVSGHFKTSRAYIYYIHDQKTSWMGDSDFDESFMTNPNITEEAMKLAGARLVGERGVADAFDGAMAQQKMIDEYVDGIWSQLANAVVQQPVPEERLAEMKSLTLLPRSN